MIYALLAIFVITIAVYLSMPRMHLVSASRPSAGKKVSGWWVQTPKRWSAAGFAVDEHGSPIVTSGKFVGIVSGQSMVDRGLVHGATFIADYLEPDEKLRLQPNDIVVVRDEAGPIKVDDKNYCLRAVKSTYGRTVEYQDDAMGRPHDPHTVDQVVALVTRTIPSSKHQGPLPAFLSTRD